MKLSSEGIPAGLPWAGHGSREKATPKDFVEQLWRQQYFKPNVKQTGLLSSVELCIIKKKKPCFRILLSGFEVLCTLSFALSDLNVTDVVAKLGYFK